jgi:hypothetical protein
LSFILINRTNTMKYQISVILVLLIVCGCYCRDVDSILQDLQKYCPFYGFEGSLQCPSSGLPLENINMNIDDGVRDSFILSGLGYDRVTREIRFPVLPSTAPISTPAQSYQAYRYTDVNDYVSAIYSEKSAFNGGLFILGDNFVNQFASIFANYRIDLAITQKLYTSYTTRVTSMAVIPEFLELLDTLPTVYNPNNAAVVAMYRERIINIFGTDVSVTSTHGGIFYQQTAVKSCYGGNIVPDMLHEMDTTIAKAPPGNLAYLHYRSLGVFDVKGGNPELPHTDYNQIIASFPLDPAITGFSSVPLWQVVPAQYQAAVKAAIDHYTGASQVSINSLIASIQAQKVQSYRVPQNVFVYGQQTEQLGSIIHWDRCPFVKEGGNYYTPRCTIPIQTVALNSGQVSTIINTKWENGILHYESQRDAASGVMRLYAYFHPTYKYKDNLSANFTDVLYAIENLTPDLNIANVTVQNVKDNIIFTPWQHTGCVSLTYLYLTANPNYKVYFTACIDCLPVVVASPARYGLKNSDLQCVCPGF